MIDNSINNCFIIEISSNSINAKKTMSIKDCLRIYDEYELQLKETHSNENPVLEFDSIRSFTLFFTICSFAEQKYRGFIS